MHSEGHNEQPNPPQQRQPADPTRVSRSLAIALITAAFFLVAAVGIVTWLFIVRSQPSQTASNNIATDDVKNVKNVSFVVPADLPEAYVKNDQSKVGATHIYYYDDANHCGFTVGVMPVLAEKSVKDTAVEAITTAQAQGITIVSQTDSDQYALADVDDAEKTYTFDSVSLEQDVKVDGVPFNKQYSAILYKQFGNKIASVSYACKAETWDEKKSELATLVRKFTVKTER